MNDEQFGWWLAGLVDGEGHFGITKSSYDGRQAFFRCVFRVAMVAEDGELLRMAHRRTGWGQVYEYDGHGKQRRPYVVWNVTTKAVALVVEHFERFPLQSKKAAAFAVWAPAARAQAQRRQLGPGRRDEVAVAAMEPAYEALRALDRGGRLARAA